MIYVYGVTEAGTRVPPVRGLEGAPLQEVRAGRLSAVCSTHEKLEPRADPDSCWAHELVVEAVMKEGAILPARFGTTFPGQVLLERALEQQADSLTQQLALVRGCAELAVRVSSSEASIARAPRDGREYLEDRLGTGRAMDGALVPLAKLAVAVGSAGTGPADPVAALSYLVRVEDVEAFCDAVRQIQDDNQQLDLSCTGPWAPYSFSIGKAA